MLQQKKHLNHPMKNHIKGLDTLRMLAALIVVWGHIEFLKKINGLPSLYGKGLPIPNGHLSVILFFVISGFLITYLLVKERNQFKTISFKKFYLRRTLRILPLYYFTLFLSYILFLPEYSTTTYVLNLSIFPNIAHTLHAIWTTSPQVWSIGVEEQFYLLWPVILYYIPQKWTPAFLIIFFVSYTFLPTGIHLLNGKYLHSADFTQYINGFFYLSKFNCLSIGALVGYLFATNNKTISYLNNNKIAYISIIGSLTLWIMNINIPNYNDEFYSILFAIALYNIVTNPKINIDTRVSSYLGKISYGIYMYHWIIILLAIKYLPEMENVYMYNALLYTTVFGGTIITAKLSYSTLERYFLNMKKRFEINYTYSGTDKNC